MPSYKVNGPGVEKARALIRAGSVDEETEWRDAQPDADAENAFIEKHGYDAFGEWHLAIDEDANEETKARYAFPFGNFEMLNRAGLTSAKQRAAQYEHEEVSRAADDLLERLDAGED